MIKKHNIVWILIFLLFLSNNAMAVNVSLSNDSFDTTVEVQLSGDATALNSGSFDTTVQVIQSSPANAVSMADGSFNTTVYIEYYVWGSWSAIWNIQWLQPTFDKPTGVDVDTVNSTKINISWTKNSCATHTYIARKEGSYPTSRTDGIEAYNGTASAFDDTGLGIGTSYYYRLWSYNSTTNAYSTNYSSEYNCTSPGPPVDLQDTVVTMSSITLTWTKGTNATKTVIVMNNTGVATYPEDADDGIVQYNYTGSTTTVEDLIANVTYYFTAISYDSCSGTFSETNDTDSATTLASADSPYNLNVDRYNDTQLNLSWSKGVAEDDTVILRKEGSFPTNPTDGTEVYNASGVSYKDEELSPATRYYYSAWGWNGVSFSVSFNSSAESTRPQPPQNLTGIIDGSTVSISWNKGINATRTILANATDAYPTDPEGTDVFYNESTGETTSKSGITDIDYFSGWSYTIVNGEHIYSVRVSMLWGGLEINVYKEDEPWIAIGNYTIYILNPITEEVFTNTSQNNPTRIDVNDVPNGEDINIQVSKDGYETRTQVMDLFENRWYQVNFYLPASSEGSPPGEEGEPWFVNGSDIDNETVASSYFILVKDIADEPIEGAYVQVKGYINETANESDFDRYDTVESGHTDSSGKLDVDLIAEKKYIVRVSKEGYETNTHVYEPPEIVYGLYEEIYHEVILQYEEEEPSFLKPDDILSLTGSMDSSGTINITYLDIRGNTIDTELILYQDYNYTLTRLYSNQKTGNSSFSLSLLGYNSSMKYYVKMFINHSDLDGMVVLPLHIYPYYVVADEDTIESLWSGVFGTIALGFVKLFLIFIPCLFLLVIFGRDHVGMGILSAGLYIGFSGYMIYVDTLVSYISLATLLIFAGIATIVAKKGGKRL